MSKEIHIFNKTKWHFRNNTRRKLGNTKKGKHPSLVIGETDDGKCLYNLGLTNSERRGHHKNLKIHNPQNWNKNSYIRNDIRIDSKEYLREVLKDYKLCPKDINKIWKFIKKRIPTRR